MSELKIKKNKDKIVKLLNETIDLEYDLLVKSFRRVYLKSDNIGSKKEPKIIKIKIGVKDDYFLDEDTNEKVKIERNFVFEIDGKKSLDGFNPIRYYSIEDI